MEIFLHYGEEYLEKNSILLVDQIARSTIVPCQFSSGKAPEMGRQSATAVHIPLIFIIGRVLELRYLYIYIYT